MTADNKKPKRDLYQEVTEKIISALEVGTTPWQRPWTALAEFGMPRNGSTGRHYNGINTILLFLEAQARGFDDCRYMTFKQASDAGYSIKKGARSVPVYFFKKLEVEERNPDTGEKTTKGIPYLTEYRVFNAQDIEGMPLPTTANHHWEPIDVMEKLVKRHGVEIQYGGNRAYYDIGNDIIKIPLRGQFPSKEAFYGTLAHEISHWTGASTRQNRQFGRFGDEAYSKEELRAEIASSMLAAQYGIPTSIENHTAYIASWIKALKNDKREIFKAASDATKIVTFLVGDEESATVDRAASTATSSLPLDCTAHPCKKRQSPSTRLSTSSMSTSIAAPA